MINTTKKITIPQHIFVTPQTTTQTNTALVPAKAYGQSREITPVRPRTTSTEATIDKQASAVQPPAKTIAAITIPARPRVTPPYDQSQEITIPQHNTPVTPQTTTQTNTALVPAKAYGQSREIMPVRPQTTAHEQQSHSSYNHSENEKKYNNKQSYDGTDYSYIDNDLDELALGLAGGVTSGTISAKIMDSIYGGDNKEEQDNSHDQDELLID